MSDRKYGSDSFSLTLDSTDPIPLSDTSSRFKKLVVQNSFTVAPELPAETDTTVKVGNSEPNIELVPGMAQDFENWDLDSVFVQGAVGLVVNVYVEY